MRRASLRLASLLAAAAMALPCCGRKGYPVLETLDSMAKAASARDAGGLFGHVAADFQAGDGSGRAEAEALVKRYFAAYEILSVSIHDVQIERSENAARVRLRADLSGQPRQVGGLNGFLPSTAMYDFDLRLVADGGTWSVAWASWTRAEGN